MRRQTDLERLRRRLRRRAQRRHRLRGRRTRWRSSPHEATSSRRYCRRTAIPTTSATRADREAFLADDRARRSCADARLGAAAAHAALEQLPPRGARTRRVRPDSCASAARQPQAAPADDDARIFSPIASTIWSPARATDGVAIGYFTKHGDGGSRSAADRPPASKSEVRALARELSVPTPIVERDIERGTLDSARPTRKRWASAYAELER